MFLDNNIFETVIDSTPLISIDLVVKNPQGHALLGLRTNRPAKDYWFVPGGRIQKNESMKDAFTRICQHELGLACSIEQATFLGTFEHFYDDSVFGEHLSTHYVVLGYEITVVESQLLLPTDQHSHYRWFDVDTLLTQDNVHQHSKWYFV
jgi:colanic acid biosynthesis protein WcaH